MDKISIVMPAYNCELYVRASIESVIAQTHTNWELLIADDRSTDKTASIIKEYSAKDPRIHYILMDQNGGAAAARNKGIEEASGEYLAFLDSDDVWLTEKLEKQLGFMKERGAHFSSTSYSFINENDEQSRWRKDPPKKCDYNKMLFMSCPIGNSTVMYKREKLADVRVPMIRKRNDFALWLKILRRVDYCYGMQEIYTLYRIRSNSLSVKKFGLAKYHWELYRYIEGLPVVTSVAALISRAFVKGFRIGFHRIR